MRINYYYSRVFLLAAFLLSVPFYAIAENAEDGEGTGEAGVDYNSDIALEIFRVCARCHTPEGWGSKDGLHPQIAGQHKEVLVKQILDIRNGLRDNPTMFPFSLHESIGGNQELSDVATYISLLPMTPDNGKGPWSQGSSEYNMGEKLYKKNCMQCHGATGEGDVSRLAPRIHGQHYQYMLRQFGWIRDGKRTNANHGMIGKIKSFSDEDIRYVINYVSRIPVPAKQLAPSVEWGNPDFSN
jgi:cytochrome c553